METFVGYGEAIYKYANFLGKAVAVEALEKDFREESGQMFAAGKDSEALQKRRLADLLRDKSAAYRKEVDKAATASVKAFEALEKQDLVIQLASNA